MKKISVVLLAFALLCSVMFPQISDAKGVSSKAKDFGISYNVPIDKVWTITLNQKVETKYNLQNYISVTDESGTKVKIRITVDGTRKKITVQPLESYAPQTKYTLFISKAMQAENGKALKDDVTKTFVTDNMEAYTGTRLLYPGEKMKLVAAGKLDIDGTSFTVALEAKDIGETGQYTSYTVEQNGNLYVGTREVHDLTPDHQQNYSKFLNEQEYYIENTGQTVLVVYVDGWYEKSGYVSTFPSFTLDEYANYTIQPGEVVKLEHVNQTMTHRFWLSKDYTTDGFIRDSLKREYYTVGTNEPIYEYSSSFNDSVLDSTIPSNAYLIIRNTFTDKPVQLKVSKNFIKVTKQ